MLYNDGSDWVCSAVRRVVLNAVLRRLEAVILNAKILVIGTILRWMLLQARPCLRPFPFTGHRVGRKGDPEQVVSFFFTGISILFFFTKEAWIRNYNILNRVDYLV